MKNRVSLLLIAVILLCVDCTEDVANASCDESGAMVTVSYSRDVFPIVAKSCAIPTCHVAAFEKGDFTKFEDLKAKAGNGMLEFKLSNGQMPPEFSKLPLLPSCEVNRIVNWINQGAQNN